MATVTHSSLTGANLHEPKGAASATIGTVYISDGAGSGSWTGLVPIGFVGPYAGTSAPSRWLLCYGQAISRTTYSSLFSAISTTYGSGDGSTTFNIPDLRGRVVAGQDDMGGTSADRLTDPLDGDTLGATGGEANGAHSHGTASGANGTLNADFTDVSTPNLSQTVQGGSGVTVAASNHRHEVVTIRGETSDANSIQPTIILNYIIYTGVA